MQVHVGCLNRVCGKYLSENLRDCKIRFEIISLSEIILLNQVNNLLNKCYMPKSLFLGERITSLAD